MKNILRKVIAVMLSALVAVTAFTTGAFALGNDVDINIGDSGNVSTNVVSGKQLIEKELAIYEGVEVSGTAATLNADGAFIEFTVEGRDTVKANFTVEADEGVTFALYLSGVKSKDITLTGGTNEVVLASDLVTGKYNFKLERTSPAAAGSVSINYISVVGGTVLEAPKGIAGDVDESEEVTLDDVVLLAQYVAGWQVDLNLDVANVNGQDEVDLDDVVLLAQFVAGWDVTLSGSNGAKVYPAEEVTMKEISANLKLTSRAAFDSSNNLKMDWSYSGFVMQGELSGDVVLTNIISWPPQSVGMVLAYCVIDNDFENKKEIIIEGMGSVGDITIARDLNPGFHTVQFFKASEAWSVSATGIKYNGKLSSAPTEKAKKIQFIGDSVTCASGLINVDNNSADKIYRSDISKGFAMRTAQYFDAEFRVQSISGSMFSYNADKASSYMYDRYLDQFATNQTIDYDFAAETQPDVVVVALGTNDAGIDSATVNEYVTKMLDMVRQKHPNAKIVWFYGMMGVGLKDNIKAAVEAYAVNDSNVYYCQASRNACSGFAGHPTAEDHEIATTELINFIKANEIL